MKKFTLLAAMAALAVGTQMGNAEEINGITVSTAEDPVYYTITNMRAARMNYVDYQDNEDGITAGDIFDAEGEVIGHDNAGGSSFWLPEFLPNGELTPNIMAFPYMGLAQVDNKFWTAFSAMSPQCMDKRTIYWWFEKAKTVKNGVYIHNAVIDGAIKKSAENVNGKPSMSFSESGKGIYYVINLTPEQMENIGFEDEEFSTDAFALSNANKVADENDEVINPNSCLDMNNYVTYNYEVDSPDETEEVQEVDADGNPVFDEDGAPVMVEKPVKLKYGFVGVNRTWNPLNPGSNDNVRINNGSLFKVVAVEDKSVVEQAIKEYEEIKAAAYRAQVSDLLESSKETTINRLSTLSNLPELYGDKADKLAAIIADINSMSVDASAVKSQEDVDTWEAQIQMNMEAQYLRAIALAGDGTVITLQQMLAIRDWADVEDGEDDNVGNAYLSADGAGQIKYNGSIEDVLYPAVTCVLEADDYCKWTMEWAGNGYRLKNGENYIRQHGNWEDLEATMIEELGWEAEDEDDTFMSHVDTNVMTWALTTDVNLAAIFTFTANATEIQNVTFNENTQTTVDTYGEALGYDLDDEDAPNYLKNTKNIAHIESTDVEGNTTYLCRDNGQWRYIVDSWNAGGQYFANANCWKIKVETAGEEVPDGIEEINATAKVAGIYDLQGRKVAKAGKGLYIINGVKTLVK